MSRKLKITVKEITIEENGVYEDEKDATNFFEALWIQPKTGVPAVRSILDLKLMNSKEFFSSKLMEKEKILFPAGIIYELFSKDAMEAQFDLELAKAQLLFKQEIEADSFLEFNISAIEKASKLVNIVALILGKATKTAFGTIPGIGTVVNSAGSSAIDSIFEGFKSDKDKLRSIGRGIIKIDEQIPVGEKIIDLFIPKEIKIIPIEKWDKNSHGDAVIKEGVKVGGKEGGNEGGKFPKVLIMGKKNGSIKIEITEI
jgi:hypothetical protein